MHFLSSTLTLQVVVKRTLAGMSKALQAVEELRETVEGVQLKQQVRGGDEGDGCGRVGEGPSLRAHKSVKCREG